MLDLRRLLVLGCAPRAHGQLAGQPRADWPTYGHDPGGQRYSPLADITPDNVAQLEVAWTYHLRPQPTPPRSSEPTARAQRDAEGLAARRTRRNRFAASQATPLMVDGRLYLTTPYARVVALDATTGRELWATPIPGPGPTFAARPRVLARRRAPRRRASSSARAMAGSSRSTQRRARSRPRSATTASCSSRQRTSCRAAMRASTA